jgi:hypothetical protein
MGWKILLFATITGKKRKSIIERKSRYKDINDTIGKEEIRY